MFNCDQCEKIFSRKDILTRHKNSVHGNASSRKRKYTDEEGDEDFYTPLKRANAVPDNWNPNESESGFGREESLSREAGADWLAGGAG